MIPPFSDYWTDFSKFEPFFETLKITKTSKVYCGAVFRPKMTLIMEENTFIGTNVVILVPKLVMERGSQICANAVLFGRQPIYLSRNVVISYGVVMGTATDTRKGKFMNDASPEDERCIRESPIRVHAESFVGANAVIMPGVDIGPRSVIGSGCYIDKTVEPNLFVYPKQDLIKLRR